MTKAAILALLFAMAISIWASVGAALGSDVYYPRVSNTSLSQTMEDVNGGDDPPSAHFCRSTLGKAASEYVEVVLGRAEVSSHGMGSTVGVVIRMEEPLHFFFDQFGNFRIGDEIRRVEGLDRLGLNIVLDAHSCIGDVSERID